MQKSTMNLWETMMVNAIKNVSS